MPRKWSNIQLICHISNEENNTIDETCKEKQTNKKKRNIGKMSLICHAAVAVKSHLSFLMTLTKTTKTTTTNKQLKTQT